MAVPRRLRRTSTNEGTLEVERIIRERLETFDKDAQATRPWEDVLADLKARRPLPPSPR